jgi:hypothetical protein
MSTTLTTRSARRRPARGADQGGAPAGEATASMVRGLLSSRGGRRGGRLPWLQRERQPRTGRRARKAGWTRTAAAKPRAAGRQERAARTDRRPAPPVAKRAQGLRDLTVVVAGRQADRLGPLQRKRNPRHLRQPSRRLACPPALEVGKLACVVARRKPDRLQRSLRHQADDADRQGRHPGLRLELRAHRHARQPGLVAGRAKACLLRS